MKRNSFYALVLIAVLALPAIPASGQASLDSLLSIAEKSNPDILTAYRQYENAVLGSRTGLFPQNPEIDYCYMWGNPQGVSNKVNLSVMQSLDFPSVYINRSRLAHSEAGIAEHYFRGVRQEALLMTKQRWTEQVFLNRRMNSIARRMKETGDVLEYLNSRYVHGEISKLGLNRAILLNASLQSEMDELQTGLYALQAEIRYLSGGNPPAVEDTLYFPVWETALDSILRASFTDPMYEAYRAEVERSGLQEKLARAQGLPGLKTGYISETLTDEILRGIHLGISIPLWENANKVKYAQGEILTAEMELARFRSTQEKRIIQLYGSMLSSRKQMEQLRAALQDTNDPHLLAMALESGEITMLDYYGGTELYYRVFDDYLAAEKAFYLAQAELSKYDL